MKQENNFMRLSASDLSHHLDCAHLISLEYAAATGSIKRDGWTNPDTSVLAELGHRHEQRYLQHLRDGSLEIVDLRSQPLDAQGMTATLAAMRQGVAAIAQGPLFHENWAGYADVLLRVETPSALGPWSYEVYDCKLSCDTKAATVLQLSLYSDLIALAQGVTPKSMYVVSPSETLEAEQFNVLEYAAYYRLIKARLEKTIAAQPDYRVTTADPNSHCEVCSWWKRCDSEWRRRDHLSLVADISRLQRKQLGAWTISTMAGLAAMPVPVKQRPDYGSREGYTKIREQARLQVAGREEKSQIFETFQIEGLARLPEPNPGDIFFDLEGDYFVDHTGLEYLFGFVRVGECEERYECRWALNAAEEKAAFEWFVESVMQSWREHPNMHVYHFTPREPSTLKRLMGRYAIREDEVDRMLRGRLFVDLHAVLKQSVRASVEQYSLKDLEKFWNFERKAELARVRTTRREIEHGLELGELKEIEPEKKQIIETYNADDCLSTMGLRDWLEQRRTEEIAKGQQIPRPEIPESAPSEAVRERQKRIALVFDQLMQGVAADPDERNEEQQARALLANMLDWHYRESKAESHEYFRLLELPEEDLLYERNALYGLEFVQHSERKNGAPTDCYRFIQQETSIRSGDKICEGCADIGVVADINLTTRHIYIEKADKAAGIHPKSVFVRNEYHNIEVFPKALCSLAARILTNGIESPGSFRSGLDLLLARPPHFIHGDKVPLLVKHETPTDAAKRIVPLLDSSGLVIQGPPGSGKTYTGAKIICELVRRGKKVGVTAIPHRVIRNLLDEANCVAREENLQSLSCLHKVNKKSVPPPAGITEVKDNATVLRALKKGTANVIGGTSWLWAREEMREAVDVLVVDEAGQMSLANVLTCSGAAKNLVLLGDPQQLEQPLKGSHPDGAAISALEHMLGGARTIAPDRGLFLEETRRLHPSICEFTSELFYDGRLNSLAGLDEQRIEGPSFLGQSGLLLVTMEHEGNQNASPQEVAVIEALAGHLLNSNAQWFNAKANPPALCPLTAKDILIIAPYNAQVSDISARLPNIEVGTVDRFQGREAAVVIYSLTTSSPEDAPRGMEFLYSLNRLNVATSRGRAMCIVVASPGLLEPHCRTPRQMQLANALCRYAELAKRIEVIDKREEGLEFRAVLAA
jgi:uncharacterized protein